MSVYSRRQDILGILIEKDSVQVSDLSRRLKVSSMTVRRDLDALAREGRISRTHGGAVLARDMAHEISFFERKAKNLKEKLSMAKAAMSFIHDGDSISLDSSTTCLAVAASIPETFNLSVVTNGLHTALRLSEKKHVSTVLMGGMVRTGSFSTVGPETAAGADDFRARVAFISATAFDPKQGAFEANMLEAEVKKAMIRASLELVLLVDSTKWGSVALNRTAGIKDIKAIITDDNIKKNLVETARKNGLKLIIAGEKEEK